MSGTTGDPESPNTSQPISFNLPACPHKKQVPISQDDTAYPMGPTQNPLGKSAKSDGRHNKQFDKKTHAI